MSYNGTYYYFYKDVFGNITHVLDSTHTSMAYYEYDAWGNCTVTQSEFDTNNIANINPFRYRGYYMDTETGYYYLQTRYYDPDIRRFISSDNYDLIPTLAQSGDLNMYAYCSNNPVMYTDPSGEITVAAIVTIVSIAITAILGAIDGGLTAEMRGEKFWPGAAAGFIGGLASGLISIGVGQYGVYGGMLSRGTGSLIYGFLNDIFQDGKRDVTRAELIQDAIEDMAFSVLYFPEGMDKIFSAILVGTLDGFVDVMQERVPRPLTPFFNLMNKCKNKIKRIFPAIRPGLQPGFQSGIYIPGVGL